MSQVKCTKAGKRDARRTGGREEAWTQTGISKPIGNKTMLFVELYLTSLPSETTVRVQLTLPLESFPSSVTSGVRLNHSTGS